jgi:hypothetical protein
MTLVSVLVLAILSHEAAHYAVLRAGGSRPIPAFMRPDRRLILSLGLGWCYDPGQVEITTRRLSYAAGPVVETAVWLGGAAFLMASGEPWFGCWCVVVGLGSLAGNWWLPGSDGRQYRRLGEA